MSDEELLDLAQSMQHHANQTYHCARSAREQLEGQVELLREVEARARTALARADAMVEALYARAHPKEK